MGRGGAEAGGGVRGVEVRNWKFVAPARKLQVFETKSQVAVAADSITCKYSVNEVADWYEVEKNLG